MASFEHDEHTVTLTRHFQFEITGPLFEGEDMPSASAREARDKIDARRKAAERQRATREKLSLPAFDDRGEPVTIRGINANTSALLGVPEGDRNSIRSIFPNVPWLRDAICEWRASQKRERDLFHRIEPFRIAGKTGYGRLEADQYDIKLREFLADLARKTDAAEKAAPKARGEQP